MQTFAASQPKLKQPCDLIQSTESCTPTKSSLYIRPPCRTISLSISSSLLPQILPSPSSGRDCSYDGRQEPERQLFGVEGLKFPHRRH